MNGNYIDGDTFTKTKLLQNMEALPDDKFINFFSNLDAFMFDCDGVLWLGNNVMNHAQELIKKLRTLEKKVFFVTNNSTKTREELVVKFNKLGFETTVDEVISPSYLAALHLKENNFTKKVYVIGTTGITRELNAVGIESLPIGPDPISENEASWLSSEVVKDLNLDPDVGAVIVGFDQFFCYKKIFKAANYLLNKDTYFIATNTDEQFPAGSNEFVIPDHSCQLNGHAFTSNQQTSELASGGPTKTTLSKQLKECENQNSDTESDNLLDLDSQVIAYGAELIF